MNDFISRSDAIRATDGELTITGEENMAAVAEYITGVVERLKALPGRPKGHWIDYVNSHCECPYCHKEWSYFENMVECFDYCPSCGADLTEDSE